MKRFLSFLQIRGFILTATLALAAGTAYPQAVETSAPVPLSAAQIVERMERHDMAQTAALEGYNALRHYDVEYHGFLKSLQASMDVEVEYRQSSGKNFRIVSESGSHVLCEKVLQRAVESEKEAWFNRETTALSEKNYTFRFAGIANLGNRPAYILDVEPLTANKFLYRGRIWVDAADFAVTKLEVQPGKNPSFWISHTAIHHTYAQTGGFWLPQFNRSESRVRIGGTAIMVIDYGTYHIVARTTRTVIGENESHRK